MQIESVTAHGFGPLAGQTLHLAPGLTVVVGANESGKSSWHAATSAALCGRRRGKGRPTAAEQAFSDAYRPWSGAEWVVSCRLELDDGRRIELRQDLSGKVDCRATDVALARDVSAEIMVEGSPDAAAWLGLTRDTFRATGCVAQSDVLGVLAAADGLQHCLQQAAATAGTSGTAARAIAALETQRRTAVGRETAAGNRPLRRAREAVAVAERRLAASRQAHEEFAVVADEAARLAEVAIAAERQAQDVAADAAAAGAELKAAEQRAVRRPVPVAAGSAVAGPPAPQVAEQPARAAPSSMPVVRRPEGLAAPIALAMLALAVLVGAVASRSVPLGVVGGVAGIAAALLWAGRTRSHAGPVRPPERPSTVPVVPPEALLTEEVLRLRYEWAERQQLTESARQHHHEAALKAHWAEAVRAERAAALPAVAEAEEQLAAAERELARVRQLDETLGLAIGFLQRAEERVHREVVPELTGLLRDWLPRLTAGRYADARMDPASLAVEVCGPGRDFHRAQLLSHGTAEQIYLLLRVALASHLTAGHDTCPLLLDDVTVHADAGRTEQLLELLHELSHERQIVLFAQQDQVWEWAERRLDSQVDGLVVLDRPG